MDKKYEAYSEIAKRAKKLKLLRFNVLSLIMDLEAADIKYNLDCERLLKADDFNFAHDICGIQNHIDRSNTCLWSTPPKIIFDETFLPRFTRTNE